MKNNTPDFMNVLQMEDYLKHEELRRRASLISSPLEITERSEALDIKLRIMQTPTGIEHMYNVLFKEKGRRFFNATPELEIPQDLKEVLGIPEEFNFFICLFPVKDIKLAAWGEKIMIGNSRIEFLKNKIIIFSGDIIHIIPTDFSPDDLVGGFLEIPLLDGEDSDVLEMTLYRKGGKRFIQCIKCSEGVLFPV